MILSKQEYMGILKQELGEHPDSEGILEEFELHLDDMLEELEKSEGLYEDEAMTIAIERLGSPMEVAAMIEQEFHVTPEKTQWTFLAINLFFFIAGIGLTIVYHLAPAGAIGHIWDLLTSIPFVIMLMYMGFWALLGYEIGKEFGLGGRRLLMTTFYLSLVPNLVLMALVVFRIVPLHWFDPLLTPSFILTCILATLLLYPISYAGFRWGTLRSV